MGTLFRQQIDAGLSTPKASVFCVISGMTSLTLNQNGFNLDDNRQAVCHANETGSELVEAIVNIPGMLKLVR